MAHKRAPHIAPVEDELDEPTPPRRRPGFGALAMTFIGLAFAVYLLLDLRHEIAFWFSSPPVVDLGAPGQYRAELAADNVVARIAGVPGPSADRFTYLGQRYEIVAVQGTNILVRRASTAPDLPQGQGRREPAPSREPFEAKGRLVVDDSIPSYGEAFRHLVERGDAQPREGHLFVLLDGDLPRTGWKIPVAMLGLAVFAGLNLWSLARYVLRGRGASVGRFARLPRGRSG